MYGARTFPDSFFPHDAFARIKCFHLQIVASHSNVMFCRLVKSCDRKVDDGYFTFKPPAKYLMNLFLNIWSIRNIWLKHECITVLRLVFVVNTFVFFTPLTFQISDWILVIKTLIFYPAAELFTIKQAVKSKTFNSLSF